MKLIALQIGRLTDYGSEDITKSLTGKVRFAGADGTIELVMSPGMVSRIIQQLTAEASVRAKTIAQQIPRAVEDAIDGGLLLENDGNVGISS